MDIEKELMRFSSNVEDYIRPDAYPIAVKMIKSKGDFPGNAKRPLRDLGHKVVFCQAFAMASQWGSTLVITPEDQCCTIPQIKFGFAENIEFYSEGSVALGYFARDLAAGKKCEEDLYGFEYGTYIALAVAPLSTANFEPDVVIVYCNGKKLQHLLNASFWNTGGSLKTSLTARAACTQIVPKIMLTGEVGIAIPCYGGRELAMIDDNTLIYAAPISKLSDVSDGLEGMAEAGATLVSHINLSWEPGWFYPYDKMSELMNMKFTKVVMEEQRFVKTPRKRGKNSIRS